MKTEPKTVKTTVGNAIMIFLALVLTSNVLSYIKIVASRIMYSYQRGSSLNLRCLTCTKFDCIMLAVIIVAALMASFKVAQKYGKKLFNKSAK